MVFFYRLLGLVALIGQRLSRIRFNFIPLNWSVMVGLFMLCGVAITAASEGFSNGEKPVNVTLADIVKGRINPSKNYVRVSGTIFPDAAIVEVHRSKYETDEQVEKNFSNKTPTRAWVFLAAPRDDGHVDSILVQLANADATEGKPHKITVSGLLKPMDSDVLRELDKEIAEEKDTRDFSINREHVLVENGVPGNGWGWSIIAVLSGVTLAMLAFTFATKYVVFQKQGAFTLPLPGPVSAATFDQPETVARATGQFFFAERRLSQRFLNVPALVTQNDEGEALVIANVDASRRLYLFTTDKRDGLWGILLGRMAGQAAEKGTLYLGGAALPSLRIKTVASPDAGPSRTVILSAQSEAEREQLIAALITPRTPRASDTAHTSPWASGTPLPFDL